MQQPKHYLFALAALMGPLWQWGSIWQPNWSGDKKLATAAQQICDENMLSDDDGVWCDERSTHTDATLPGLKNSPHTFLEKTVTRTAPFQLKLPETSLLAFEVVINDLTGQPVRRLLRGKQSNVGETVAWDGKDDADQFVPAGKYWYRVKTDKRIYSKMLIVTR